MSQTTGSLRGMIAYLVEGLVDAPEQVKVTESERDDFVTIEISVAQPDIAKVIGRHGRVAIALRAVARAVAEKSGQRVAVDILD